MPAPKSTHQIAPATRVLRQFRIVFNAMKTHFRQVEKQAGIAGAQLWALSVIQQQPGISVGDLARALDVHQSTASNLVKTLLSQELIVAAKEGSDRRAVALRISENGMAVLNKAPLPLSGVLPDALAGLEGETLERLEQDLAVLIAALDQVQIEPGSARKMLSEL